MGCRKNQASLTAAERAAFVNAVVKLKAMVPSQLHPGDPDRHRYDDYVETHMNSMMLMNGNDRIPGWAHRGPAFYPWHREMLRHFELDLQKIDPSVTLPYWDWTVDQSNTALPWTDDFMGAMHNGTDEVTTGPFNSGVWVKKVMEPGDNDPKLRRALGRPALGALASVLPTHDQVYGVSGALTETPYDSPAWNDGTSPSFRDRAEGWHGAGSIHNRVHLWVGGSMLPSTSPNDPIFFLHHCNVDRLLSQWQKLHASETYHPTGSGGELGPPGHNLNEALLFNDLGQPSPWSPVTTTPAQLWNHHLPPASYWYDTDPPQVQLVTPSVSFVDIPEGVGGTGVTTYRPVRLAVLSCAGATFQITAGPTPPFTAPLGTTFIVGEAHGAPAAEARVWIGYTSTTAGSSVTGSVTVHCVETGEDFVVPLSANTVARPKSAIALVLDHSGSMSEDAGDGQPKVQKLKQAVSAFVALMQPGDGLSIVRFDDTAQILFPVNDVGPVTPVTPGSGRDQAQNVIAGTQLDPAGATSIGGGIVLGKQSLNTAPATNPPWAVKAMLVVTDGVENTSPTIADAASSLTANSFAIGIGTPANINVAALDALTQGHGGYLVVTGAITTDQSFRLTKYFLQALAGITNAQVVVDPQGELVWGANYSVPFLLVEPDLGTDVVLLSPAAAAVEFALETPGGKIVTPATAAAEAAIQFVQRTDLAFYRFSLPALHAEPMTSRGGQWKVRLRLNDKLKDGAVRAGAVSTRRSIPFSVLVHAYSNLRFHAALLQKSREPGAVVSLQASLVEYDVPVERRAVVWAEVTRPDGVGVTIALDEGVGGLFAGQFVAAVSGLYTVRVRATGSTFSGRQFEREKTLTAVALPGADRQGQTDPGLIGWLNEHDARICRLLTCLVEDGALDKFLAERGIDIDILKRCIARFCRDIGPKGGETPRQGKDQPISAQDLRRALTLLSTEALHPDAIATMPEAKPVAAATFKAQPGRGKSMKGTMFGLSEEDLKAGEPPVPKTTAAARGKTSAKASSKGTSPRGPKTRHGLSAEDVAAEKSRKK